jgi:two-component system response regulator AtoC
VTRARTFDEATVPERGPIGGEPREAGALSILVFDRESSWVFRLPARGPVLIGRRQDGDLCLREPGISSRHAELEVIDGRAWLRDLDSKNGTRVNGRRISERIALSPGDVVTISTVALVLRTGHVAHAERDPVAPPDFRRRADEELDRALRYKRLLTVGCLGFERPPGDPRAIAAALDTVIRPMDVFTWSSDSELTLLMPELGPEDAFTVLGRLRVALPADPALARIGFGSYPTDGCELEDLVAAARAERLASPSHSSGAAQRAYRLFEIDGQQVIVSDAAMLRVYAMIGHLAPSGMPVLIQGETGTGKELVALALHHWSPRRSGPFVAINCAALAEGLIESELFGHERGSFTGASASRAGVFERADGGTVFLDEIGELPQPMQAKLLRVLETKRLSRVGSTDLITSDFRVVAATNRKLEAQVEEGRFRLDLYYRLGAATVWLPPLRERRAELLLLAQIFLDEACRAAGRPPLAISPDGIRALGAYDWPGNVRELRNAAEYLANTVSGGEVDARHIEDRFRGEASRPPAPAAASFRPIYEEIAELERARIEEALRETDGNLTRAAALIQMPLRTFHAKLREHGLSRTRGRRGARHTTPVPGQGAPSWDRTADGDDPSAD